MDKTPTFNHGKVTWVTVSKGLADLTPIFRTEFQTRPNDAVEERQDEIRMERYQVASL